MTTDLSVYDRLSRLRWPSSYIGKFLLIAFLGVHVPLIALVLYVTLSVGDWTSALPFLLIALLATLAGALATLLVQGKLLAPLLLTSRAMNDYVHHRARPALPTTYSDEAGLLMRAAQETITHLDELIRLKNQLLAVLSHDTRAPLSTIMMANSTLRDLLDAGSNNREITRKMLLVMQRAADQQLELMNNILLLARAETGQIEITRKRVLPSEIIERVAANAELQANQKGVELRVKDRTDRDSASDLDEAKTEQVLNNLVSNALKFTAAGGWVEIAAAADSDTVEFEVRDSGIGISPEARAKLFTAFTRAHRPGTADEPGTGLGLWIAKTFTEVQGGSIELESETGRGTCFRVRLPRCAPADPQVSGVSE